jgi:hypothetical protein
MQFEIEIEQRAAGEYQRQRAAHAPLNVVIGDAARPNIWQMTKGIERAAS